ncbi:hypothetical protein MKW98_024679 [Papaver atlanticum]|uniref:Uncharacterized protein n=1 Tax=Papaver atlanticum TaxID=357466 RepID=A0AAD4X7W5_9MAGN|nr:hypothetical protein MKW98_024679 [Papaver atlanticum]
MFQHICTFFALSFVLVDLPCLANSFHYVMVLLKGSVPISFGGSEENIAFGELTFIGGLNADVNKKLSATIPEDKISVSKSRFFIKFTDTKASNLKLLADLLWHMLRSHSFSHWSNACLHRH